MKIIHDRNIYTGGGERGDMTPRPKKFMECLRKIIEKSSSFFDHIEI